MGKHKFIRRPKKPQIKRIDGANYDMRRIKFARHVMRVSKTAMAEIPFLVEYLNRELGIQKEHEVIND